MCRAEKSALHNVFLKRRSISGNCGNCQFFISAEDPGNKGFTDVDYDWACC